MSDDSSTDMMELDEAAHVADPHLEQNLKRLQEEERLLLDKQAALEAGTFDDIAALENQDALRLNQMQQQELKKRAAKAAQRLAIRQHGSQEQHGQSGRREQTMRRRTTCTVRVTNVHTAEAIETDV